MHHFAEFMVVVVASTASFVAIALGARLLWHLGSRYALPPNAPPPMDEGRMERLEQAIDAIAIEVERISEAQRFTTTLLADRLVPRGTERSTAPDAARNLPPSPPRTTTPH
jgi:hypothetical protein